MGKLVNTYSVFAAAVLALLCSCSKDKGDVVPQDGAPEFVLATKAENIPDGSSLRIMAFGTGEQDHLRAVAEGTYKMEGKDLNGFPYLTSVSALRVPYGQVEDDFLISYVSPAIEHTEGGFVADLANPFYCSDVERVQLFNYGKVYIDNPLVDRRAKIGFKFFKDKAEKKINITDVALVGAGNTYWPASKQVTPTDAQVTVTLKSVPENADLQIFECKNADDMPFVLSGKYAPKDTVASHIYGNTTDYGFKFTPTNLQESGYLMVQFNLYVNEGGPMLVTAPLTYNANEDKAFDIEPLKAYMYKIHVSDTYISTILEVYDFGKWEEIEFGWKIEDNTEPIKLGNFEFSDWENNLENGKNPWEEDNKDINSKNN